MSDPRLIIEILRRTETQLQSIAPNIEGSMRQAELEIRQAEEANASGRSDSNVIDGDRTLSDLGSAAREGEGGFISCRFVGNRWRRQWTLRKEQPPDGFTLAGHEPEDQIRLLEQAYEESSEEDRNLLRKFAAASIGVL